MPMKVEVPKSKYVLDEDEQDESSDFEFDKMFYNDSPDLPGLHMCQVCKSSPAAGELSANNSPFVYTTCHECLSRWAMPVAVVLGHVHGVAMIPDWLLKSTTYHCGQYVSVAEFLRVTIPPTQRRAITA